MARYEKQLFTVLVILFAFILISGGRYVLHHFIVENVHADICRSKPDQSAMKIKKSPVKVASAV
jgi:hypothetical protein